MQHLSLCSSPDVTVVVQVKQSISNSFWHSPDAGLLLADYTQNSLCLQPPPHMNILPLLITDAFCNIYPLGALTEVTIFKFCSGKTNYR